MRRSSVLFLSSGESRGTRATEAVKVIDTASSIDFSIAAPVSLTDLTSSKHRQTNIKQKHFFALRCPGVNLRSFACACCFIRSDDPRRTTLPEILLVSPHQFTPHRSLDPKSLQDRSQLRRNRTPLVRPTLSPRPIQQRHILFDTQRQKALVAGSQATLARLSPRLFRSSIVNGANHASLDTNGPASLAGRFPPSRQLLRR